MGNAGSAIGNFFKNDVAAMGNFFEGAAGVLGTTLGGIFTGNFSGYGNAVSHFTRYGSDVAGAFTGRSVGISGDVNPSSAPSQSDLYNQMISNTNPMNAGLSQIVSTPQYVGSRASYSPSGGLGGVMPPSAIARIGNPGVKLAVASSRGSMRNMLNMVGNGVDSASAGAIQGAMGGPISATNPVATVGGSAELSGTGSSTAVNMTAT
jgi:hypothetical protein